MDPKRKEILQHIRDFAEKGGDTEEFIEVMRQAWVLRPPPWELLRKVRQQHWGKMASRLKQDESNVLDLMWLRREPIELRSVEELLQRLVEAVAPEAQARFHSHDIAALNTMQPPRRRVSIGAA